MRTTATKVIGIRREAQRDEREKSRLERWKIRNKDLIGYVHEHQRELWGDDEEDFEEDIVTEEMLEAVEYLSRDAYNVSEILNETSARSRTGGRVH